MKPKFSTIPSLFVVLLVSAVLILTACNQAAASSNLTGIPVASPQPTLAENSPASGGSTPAPDTKIAAEARQILATQLGVNPDQIKTVSIEPKDWPDSCLGIQLPGIMCAQHVVPGYQIVLEANPYTYKFHTGQGGNNPVEVPSLNITWQVGDQCNAAAIQYDQDVEFGFC